MYKKIKIAVLASMLIGIPGIFYLISVSSTPEERFASRFIAALNADDETALQALLMGKEDFSRDLWHHMPAFDPSWNVTLDDVWELYEMKRGPGIRRALRDWGGQDLTVESIRFGKEERYGEYRLRRDPVLVVRTPAGERDEINAAGPAVLYKGEYQLLAFRR